MPPLSTVVADPTSKSWGVSVSRLTPWTGNSPRSSAPAPAPAPVFFLLSEDASLLAVEIWLHPNVAAPVL